MPTKDELLERCLCFDVRRTSRLITRIYERYLEPSGLTPTQRGAMKFLEESSMSIPTLATMIDLDRTSLRRLLDPLERDGFIAVVPGEDRRTRVISLTPQGKHALMFADKCWREAQDHVMEAFGESHWGRLVGTLRSTRKLVHTQLSPDSH